MSDNELLRMLWRGRYLLVASLAVSIVAAILVTSQLPRVYEASGIVQVQSTESQATPGELQALQQVSQSLAASYATLLGSNAFLQRLQNHTPRLKLSDLQNDVSASVLTVDNSPTNLIKIVATGSTPAEAARLAGNVANAFVALIRADADARASNQRAQLTSQIDALDKRIARLRGASGASAAEQVQSLTAARAALAGQLATVVANEISAGQSVGVVAPPSAESAPVSPHPSLNLVIGALLGLLVGLGLAVVRDRIDTGLGSPKEAEDLLGVPNLATIPRASGRPEQALQEYFTKEAYELLRTNLSFVAVERNLKMVTITSYNAAEGKSSVAAGLATAAVHSGLKVLLVDGDLRTSELSRRLAGKAARLPGLTNLVLNTHTRPQSSRARAEHGEVAKYLLELGPNLWLLPSGVTPPNPASFLSGPAVGKVFASLRHDYDLVIVDSPPVAHLADAALLSAHSDGVVLVTRIGLAKRSDLVSAADNLRHLPTPIVGCVVVDARPAAGDQYYGARASRAAERPRLPARVLELLRRGRSALAARRGSKPPAEGAPAADRPRAASSGAAAPNGSPSAAERKPTAR